MSEKRRRSYGSKSRIGYLGKVIYPSLVNDQSMYRILYLDEDNLTWKFGAYIVGITPGGYNGFSHITTDLGKNMYITYTKLDTTDNASLYITVHHIDLSSVDIFDQNVSLATSSNLIYSGIAANRNYGYYSIDNLVSVVNSGYLWIYYDRIYNGNDRYLLVINPSNGNEYIRSFFFNSSGVDLKTFKLYSTNEGVYGLRLEYNYNVSSYYVYTYKFNPRWNVGDVLYTEIQSYCVPTNNYHHHPVMVGNKVYIATEDSDDSYGYVYCLDNALTSVGEYNYIHYISGVTNPTGGSMFTSSFLMNNLQYTDLTKPIDLTYILGSYIGSTDQPIYKYGSSGKLSKVTITDPTGTNNGYWNMNLGTLGMIKVSDDLWVGRYNEIYSNPYLFITRDECSSIQLVDSASFLGDSIVSQACITDLPITIV